MYAEVGIHIWVGGTPEVAVRYPGQVHRVCTVSRSDVLGVYPVQVH